MPEFLFLQILLDRSPLRWEFSRQVTYRLAFSILPWGLSSFCPRKVKVMAMITGGGHILNSAQAVEKDHKRLDTTKTAIQLMEDILHLGSLSPCLQGSAPSQVVSRISSINSINLDLCTPTGKIPILTSIFFNGFLTPTN